MWPIYFKKILLKFIESAYVTGNKLFSSIPNLLSYNGPLEGVPKQERNVVWFCIKMFLEVLAMVYLLFQLMSDNYKYFLKILFRTFHCLLSLMDVSRRIGLKTLSPAEIDLAATVFRVSQTLED